MPADAEHNDLLAAAQALLAARADGMVTQDEWDALERAVRAMGSFDGADEPREAQDQ